MDELDLGQTVRGFAAGQKLFNRYSLVRILGRGGMGVVWLARDEELERDVALKFLPELLLHDQPVLLGLKRETKRSLELTHPHIVRIYDFVQDAQSACISMEYVDGETLSNLRAQKPNNVFESRELEKYVRELCEALDYAHNKARIVHRDLKPANLMVNGRDELKIADFGIARSLTDSVSMMTMSRGSSGTLVYMSPQQLDGERTSHLDDIYSVGATLYELLTSKPPFYSGGIERQIHEKTSPSIASRREELEIASRDVVPSHWEETIAACLAKDPARRPQSVADVAGRLHSAWPSAPAEPSSKRGIASKSPSRTIFRSTGEKSRKRRFSARLVALAASTVVLLAMIVVFWKERSTTQPAERGSKISQENSTPAQPSSFDKATAAVPASERIPPRPKKYFNDYAGVISVDAVARFNEQLAAFERESSNQVVVAVDLKKESTAPIDGYTRRVANAWGVGQADRQNGVVLFVFIEDRQMFLQVGEGLEDVLSNAKAFDITEHQIKPHFRTGDYEGGFKAGIEAICDATRNRYKGDGKTAAERKNLSPTARQ